MFLVRKYKLKKKSKLTLFGLTSIHLYSYLFKKTNIRILQINDEKSEIFQQY